VSTATSERVGNAQVPTLRSANVVALREFLNERRAHRINLIVPAEKLRFTDGMLLVEGQEVITSEEGITDPNGVYWPTKVFDDQVAERLDVTAAYLRRLRHGKIDARGKATAQPRLDLWDANVNGLLHGRNARTRGVHVRDEQGEVIGMEQQVLRPAVPSDPRSFFLRLFSTVDGVGIADAFLSNRYAPLDHIDGFFAMLTGLEEAGIDLDTVEIFGDVSPTRMFVHVRTPQILAAAPTLLDGYQSPFRSATEQGKRQGRGYTIEDRVRLGRLWREQGRAGLGDDRPHGFYPEGQEPLVHAGFCWSNSENGFGRYQITPEITMLACTNGMQITKDAFGRTHVGERLDDGLVDWSDDTQSKVKAAVTAQTRDMVKTVLSVDYLQRTLGELSAKADKPVEQPERVIEVVAKKLAFTKEQQDGILRHFLLGGQITSGGVMHAVTSFSQTVADPDAAHDLNNRAVEAMELAYAAA
jgi:hypothetical protein